MFKDVTGHAIGAYIRARRLSKSAVALRLTARPILDIALQYRFDSQQTFTARLKSSSLRRRRYIAVLQNGAPLAFVRRCVWVSSPCLNISLSPWKIRNCSAPRAIPVRWSKSPIFDTKCATGFWQDFLSQAPTIPPLLYGLNETRPSLEKDDEQEVFYTTALPQEHANGYVPSAQPVTLQGGEYVMFTYEGLGTGVQGVYPDGIRHLYADAEPDPP